MMQKEDSSYFAAQMMAGRVTRREFLRQGALLGMSVPAMLALLGNRATVRAAKSTKVVNVSSYGGSYNDNFQKSYLDAFTKETGIKVNLGASASLALAKLQAQSGNPQWDLVELDGSEQQVAIKQNLLERLDPQKVDMSKVPSYLKTPYGYKYSIFLFVMVHDQRKIADANAPQTWAQFWDTKRYHTKRSLYQNVVDGSILEAALMADGVAISKIYPLDMERALKSLDRLGKANIVWHSTNQEPIQQLISGEVSLATAFSGRVNIARRQGAKLQYTPSQGIAAGTYLPVIKGAPNKEAAFQLLNFIATNDQAAAKFMMLTTYATANVQAVKLLPKSLAAVLPTSAVLKGKVLFKDDSWWAEHLDSATTRFKQWQAS